MRLLITGINGFVGKALAYESTRRGIQVKGVVRSPLKLPPELETSIIDVIDGETDWMYALKESEVVVHLAARVHVKNESAADPSNEYRTVNVDGTLNLARQAVEANVRRFVFISSIKVNGESTPFDKAFTANDIPDPRNPYSVSKNDAEQGLRKLAVETGMEVVIIRPPLVYGPEVKANFLTMMRWLYNGIPLPFGAIHNQRSLVALDNLVDLIITCLDRPAAANQVFLAGDGEDLSTTELLRRLGLALGKPARMLPVPVALFKAGTALIGRRDIAQRLCGSLRVDISKARNLLGWNPPISVDEGLRRTAQSFLAATTKK
ncbi:MAG: SDR family oxidoreductase [Deltaproteobacteria bacterium]|nr:SDR family oxidoreductase [Deltaproteobacteria bacterium]